MMVQLALFIFLPFRVRLALPVALLGTVGATLRVWVASSNGVHSITDLPNRRAFLDRLNAELARAQRSGEALSLAMFDLDPFKQMSPWMP